MKVLSFKEWFNKLGLLPNESFENFEDRYKEYLQKVYNDYVDRQKINFPRRSAVLTQEQIADEWAIDLNARYNGGVDPYGEPGSHSKSISTVRPNGCRVLEHFEGMLPVFGESKFYTRKVVTDKPGVNGKRISIELSEPWYTEFDLNLSLEKHKANGR